MLADVELWAECSPRLTKKSNPDPMWSFWFCAGPAKLTKC